MLQRRRLIAVFFTLGGLFVLYSIAAYWCGLKAQQALQEQHRMLLDLSLFKVKAHTYERDWFSSHETTELIFNRKLSGPYELMLPDNLKSLLDSTIKYTHIIKHGPFPGISHFDLRPAQALVFTEFAMSDSTRDTLKRFFGDKNPITVLNRLSFSGGGELAVSIPAFDYEETLSGIKMAWKGFLFKLHYQQGYQQYQTEAISPGFLLQASDKGALQFDDVNYISDIRPGRTGLALGTSEFSVSNIQLQWKDSIPYSIKLNELLYLLTRVRIGEFINPSGEFSPSNVSLRKFKYQIVTSEQEEFINSRGKVAFDTFSYPNHTYGPLRFDVSANHLHGPTLKRLDKEMSAIPFEGVEPGELRKHYIDAIKQHGLPLLENNPRLVINEFFLHMPSGDANLTGVLALTGFKRTDLKAPLGFLKRLSAEAKFSLPRATLETLVIAQARNLFTVDETAEDQPNLKEIDNLAKQLLNNQLIQWVDEGFIQQENGILSSELAFKNSELTISKKKVVLPWGTSSRDLVEAPALTVQVRAPQQRPHTLLSKYCIPSTASYRSKNCRIVSLPLKAPKAA